MATILISGANRGIGLELARLYLSRGFEVVAGVRDPASAPAGALAGATVLALDVASDESVAALAAALKGRPIDILVNNAGVIGPPRQSSTDMDFAGFLDTLNVNTVAPLRLTQALLPNLRLSKLRPRVAVLTSRMGSLSSAQSDSLAYRASKAAANKVVQGLATDLVSDGIAVAAIHPGWVRTDMGGSAADIDAATSVRGIAAVLDGLALATTGRFVDHGGNELPW
ncbi:MAG: SDR family oxidoreductase [Aquabacterium sp.]|nr:MAG: SDR family oxidoreductase [Aquabacterium sp.]